MERRRTDGARGWRAKKRGKEGVQRYERKLRQLVGSSSKTILLMKVPDRYPGKLFRALRLSLSSSENTQVLYGCNVRPVSGLLPLM